MVMASLINTDMFFYVLNVLQFSITEANIIVFFETEVQLEFSSPVMKLSLIKVSLLQEHDNITNTLICLSLFFFWKSLKIFLSP